MISTAKIKFFWFLLILMIFLGLIRIWVYSDLRIGFIRPQFSSSAIAARQSALKKDVYVTLFSYGIRVDWIGGDSDTKRIRIPKDLAIVEPYTSIVNRIREHKAQILRAETNPFHDVMTLEVGFDDTTILHLTFFADENLTRNAGKIAIVIDDFGYSQNDLVEGFLNLGQQITLSIIPGLTYSAQVSESARERNLEVMIHLPMEPKNGKFSTDDYAFGLLTEMAGSELREQIRRAIKSVPGAVGLNNHMGSKATENDKLLAVLMSELKKTDLFFLDSKTSSGSRALHWARKTNLPCSLNNVFLDAIHEKVLIKRKLKLLAEIASRRGYAVGIGHVNELTLEVLQEEIPELLKRGFEFVNVSKIVE